MAASTAGTSSSPSSCCPPSAPTATAASTPAGFPVPAASFDAPVHSVPTRFVVASFGDCFFVSATQTGALGTIMKVTRGDVRLGGEAMMMMSSDDGDGDRQPASSSSSSSMRPRPRPLPLSSFDVATLSGRRDSAVLEASARSLASTLVAKGVERPATIVSLALRDDEDAAMARGVVEKLREAIAAS